MKEATPAGIALARDFWAQKATPAARRRAKKIKSVKITLIKFLMLLIGIFEN